MNKKISWLIFILVLFVLILFSTNGKKDERVEVSQNNDVERVENSELNKVPNEETIWKWNEYTYTLPANWGAHSADGGSTTTLFIGKNLTFFDQPNGSYMIIYRTGKCDYDVEAGKPPAFCMTQDEFMKDAGFRYNGSNPGEEKIISQESTSFLGKQAIKQITERDDKYYEKYYIKGIDFTTFVIPLNDSSTDKIRFIVEGINLSPTEEEFSKARNTP